LIFCQRIRWPSRPWTDLALTGQSLTEYGFSDPMVPVELMPRAVELYLAGADPRSPYASPLYGDPASLPPTLIHVSSDEALRDDAVRMAQRQQAPASAGTPPLQYLSKQ
jgi:epsilon-lactone hydrolase